MARVPVLLTSLVALGCGSDPAPAPADDYVARFPDDPHGVRADVLALEDPVAQEVAVVALVEAFPGETASLCTDLPTGPVRTRCERFNTRPHLWTPPPLSPAGPGLPLTPRLASGPSNQRLLLPAGELPALAADGGGCAPGAAVCLEQEAEDLAQRGQVDAAASRCAAIAEGKGQQDCFFRAAEALPAGPEDYAGGVALCQRAGAFAPECHAHVVLKLSDGVGARLSAATNASATTRAEAIEAAWANSDPAFGALAADQFWSTYLHWAVVPAPETLRGVELPPAAGPHLRALRAFAVSGADEVAGAAEAWRVDTGPPVPPASAEAVVQLDLWQADLPGEGEVPAVFLAAVAGGRRPISEDPATDQLLAVLEVLARQRPPALEAVAAHVAHADPLVRWTVARTLGWRAPDHPARAELLDDPDPLVRQRARWVSGGPQPRGTPP